MLDQIQIPFIWQDYFTGGSEVLPSGDNHALAGPFGDVNAATAPQCPGPLIH